MWRRRLRRGQVEGSPSLRVGEWKVVYGTQLFHIAKDPSETTDLAASQPLVLARLRKRLAELNATAVPPCDRLTPDAAANPARHGGVWTPWRASVSGNGCPQKEVPAVEAA